MPNLDITQEEPIPIGAVIRKYINAMEILKKRLAKYHHLFTYVSAHPDAHAEQERLVALGNRIVVAQEYCNAVRIDYYSRLAEIT